MCPNFKKEFDNKFDLREHVILSIESKLFSNSIDLLLFCFQIHAYKLFFLILIFYLILEKIDLFELYQYIFIIGV
jgi:hypothetical protein